MKKPWILYLDYVPLVSMFLNNHYAEILQTKGDSINTFLKQFGLQFQTIYFGDCAPSEFEYTLGLRYPHSSCNAGLSAFTFYMLLKHSKKVGNIDLLQHECEKAQRKFLEKQKRAAMF